MSRKEVAAVGRVICMNLPVEQMPFERRLVLFWKEQVRQDGQSRVSYQERKKWETGPV